LKIRPIMAFPVLRGLHHVACNRMTYVGNARKGHRWRQCRWLPQLNGYRPAFVPFYGRSGGFPSATTRSASTRYTVVDPWLSS
jgi:hypothetical protein